MFDLKLRQREVAASDLPLVMGVLNVTPDSFSDGGEYLEPSDAVDRALIMIAQGADIIDIGPESTRPGSEPVAAQEQIRRAIPVIERIRERDPSIPISIDTRLAPVAERALDAGADMINDVSALLHDPTMARLAADRGVPVVLMHHRGTPRDMQSGGGPRYDDVVNEICAFLQERIEFAAAAGIDRSRIVIDPGIGFGKRVEHNLAILRNLQRFVDLGHPVLVGASRKSFMGDVLKRSHRPCVEQAGVAPADEPARHDPSGRSSNYIAANASTSADPGSRLASSLATAVIAAMAGVAIIRVHDVAQSVDALQLCRAVRESTR